MKNYGVSLIAALSVGLAAAFPSEAAAITVHCSQGGSLQSAIYAAPAGATVNIDGRCADGPYYIYRDVSLVGLDDAATLAAPAGDRVVYVTAANVSLQRLHVDANGSVFGVIVEERGKAALDRIDVYGASGPGILVQLTSYASIVQSRSHNNSIGVDVVSSSSAWIVNSETRDNGNYGIQARKASALDIISSRATSNAQGLVIDESSSAELHDVTLRSNGYGVWVPHVAVVRFTGTLSTVEENGLDVLCGAGGSVLFDAPQLSATKRTAFDARCVVENQPFVP